MIYNFVSLSFHAAKGLVRIRLHEECFKLLNIIMIFSYFVFLSFVRNVCKTVN